MIFLNNYSKNLKFIQVHNKTKGLFFFGTYRSNTVAEIFIFLDVIPE